MHYLKPNVQCLLQVDKRYIDTWLINAKTEMTSHKLQFKMFLNLDLCVNLPHGIYVHREWSTVSGYLPLIRYQKEILKRNS